MAATTHSHFVDGISSEHVPTSQLSAEGVPRRFHVVRSVCARLRQGRTRTTGAPPPPPPHRSRSNSPPSDGKPVSCAKTYQNVGTSKAAMFVQDFRIYVSAVRLIAKDGRNVPVQ